MKPSRLIAAIVLMALLFSAGQALPAEKAKAPAKVPTVTAPTEAEPHKLVRMSVDNCDSAVWFLEPAEVVDLETGADGKSIVWTAPPGTYTIHTVTLTAGKLGQIRSKVTIKGGTPTPVPDPTPGPPEPKPNPSPIAPGKLWAICVLPDLAKQTPEQGLTRVKLAMLLDSRGDNLRWVDPQTAPPALAQYLKVAQERGLPACLVADNDKGVVEATTIENAVQAVTKWQGGKR